MSRLIDADALPRHGQCGGIVHWKDIEDAPSIDIVRCGECKHWNEEDHWCNIRDSYGWDYKADDFCSYGERKRGRVMTDRPYWCEICARKKECYGITLKPKCFVPTADRKTEPTSSKMEQVDRDINVRSKEPQIEYCPRCGMRILVDKPKDEPQAIRCPKCGRTDYIRDMEKDMGIKGSRYKYKCINCNTYIKDEPQTEREGE